jgi:hypothetical protein
MLLHYNFLKVTITIRKVKIRTVDSTGLYIFHFEVDCNNDIHFNERFMVSTIIFVSYVESSNCMGVFLILCIEVDEKNSLIFFCDYSEIRM